MQRITLVAGLAAGAAGASCEAGYKLKKVLTGLTCDSSSASAKDCNTNCCELDPKTCGGSSPTCGSGYYTYTSGATDAQKDAWKNTATDSASKNTVCCTKKTTCASRGYTCPAGQKYNAANAATECPSDAASCVSAAFTSCCKNDDTTCGGKTAFNPATGCTGDYLKPTANDAYDKTDSWKSINIKAAANTAESCCAIAPICSSNLYSCPVGYKKVDNAATLKCSGSSVTTCASTTGNCCKKDGKTCAGLATAPTCTVGRYLDSALNHVAATTKTGPAVCCSAVATCASYTCSSGKKKKLNIDATKCTKGADSCTDTTCCEDDKATCGGIKATTGLACATGFYDESTKFVAAKYTQAQIDAWNKKTTTEATKNTDCCTALAKCDAVLAGVTTTPAAAAITVTPAAPARLFSQHKAAVAATTSNVVWLVVGGFVGMGSLFAVQKLRRGSTVFSSVDSDMEDVQALVVNEQ